MSIYKIEVPLHASKETVWKAITNFKAYPDWNSVLILENNDNLTINESFHVTIIQENGKLSKFKAPLLSKDSFKIFSAQQTMLAGWFFQATHHFIIEEVSTNNVTFIQKWELRGIMASIFQKLIFKQLATFKKMNTDLKAYVENKS